MADNVSTSFSFHTLEDDKNFYIGHGLDGEYKLTGVTIVPSNDVTGSSNKFTLAVKQGSTAVCSSFDSETTALTDGTPQALTMAAAGASLVFGSGDAAKFEYDESGTLALTMQVICAWQKYRA